MSRCASVPWEGVTPSRLRPSSAGGKLPRCPAGRPAGRSLLSADSDAGVTLIDTADAYHRDADEVGHNEILISTELDAA